MTDIGMRIEYKDVGIYRSPVENPKGPIFYPKLSGSELAWFALYVQVNHEKEVQKRVEQKTVECYLPLLECWSKRLDRRKRIQKPLFPGYIFVHTILDNYTNVQILKTPGAISILKSSEGPLPIPPYQIDSLKKVLGSTATVSLYPYLKEGDRIEVVRGPLVGCVGVLIRQNQNRGTLVISVDIIQRSVSVELNMEDIKPIH